MKLRIGASPRRVFFALLALAGAGCGGGALEERVVYKDIGGPYFNCKDNAGKKSDDSESTYYHWPDNTCADLGYTKPTSTSAIFNAAGSNIAGKCGHWGTGLANCAGGGSSGGGGTSGTCAGGDYSVCNSAWTCDPSDQAKYTCSAACSGKVACNEKERQTNCSLLAGYGSATVACCTACK